MLMESVNGTSWNAILERTKQTEAAAMCLQEHRLPESAINEKSQVLANMGWKSLWAPATCTNPNEPDDLRNYSGGVAVIVKDYLGFAMVEEDESPIIEASRLVAGKVTVPGIGPFVLYSAYFECGTGWNQANEAMANAIVRHAERHCLAWAVGADWNMEPT